MRKIKDGMMYKNKFIAFKKNGYRTNYYVEGNRFLSLSQAKEAIDYWEQDEASIEAMMAEAEAKQKDEPKVPGYLKKISCTKCGKPIYVPRNYYEDPYSAHYCFECMNPEWEALSNGKV